MVRSLFCFVSEEKLSGDVSGDGDVGASLPSGKP